MLAGDRCQMEKPAFNRSDHLPTWRTTKGSRRRWAQFRQPLKARARLGTVAGKPGQN